MSFLSLLLAISVFNVQGQAVIDVAGGEATGSGGTSSYSVGQIVYQANSAASGSENQGVQQPYEFTALPVTLVYFEVKSEIEQVQVRWETAAEKNNDFFTVERSSNSVAFEEVANITGQGDSNSNRKYSWTDANPYSGISYYRLKQTDLDKSYTYSRIRAVSIKSLSSQIETYPNPVNDYLILKDDNENHSRSYKIFDLNGRLIESAGLSEGERKIDMTHLFPQTYLIHYMNGSEVQKIKIIKN